MDSMMKLTSGTLTMNHHFLIIVWVVRCANSIFKDERWILKIKNDQKEKKMNKYYLLMISICYFILSFECAKNLACKF